MVQGTANAVRSCHKQIANGGAASKWRSRVTIGQDACDSAMRKTAATPVR